MRGPFRIVTSKDGELHMVIGHGSEWHVKHIETTPVATFQTRREAIDFALQCPGRDGQL